MYTSNNGGNNNANIELPITALCIVSEKTRCPPNYTPIVRSYDTATEPDLWKDSFFAKKINRFFCYTKDYPINETYNVIEDIKLLNERETLPGFIPLEKCLDTSEKSFQKKVVNIKVSHRFYTTTAVSDIVLLVKTKRPPAGYSYIGEINGHAVCIKFSSIPNNTSAPSQRPQATPPPIPPRPYSTNFGAATTIDTDFNHVPRLPPQSPSSFLTNGIGAGGFPMLSGTASTLPSDSYFKAPATAAAAPGSSSLHHTQTSFNPLHGVPFEINPVYNFGIGGAIMNELIDREIIERKVANFNQVIAKMNYDFKLEKTLITQLP